MLRCCTVVFVFVFSAKVVALLEGDSCTYERRNVIGVCTKIVNCKSAIESLYLDVQPQTCSVDGAVLIVCCPDNNDQSDDKIKTTTASSVFKVPRKQPNEPGYKSQQKCKEYAKYVYEVIPDLSLGLVKLNTTKDTCVQRPTKLIVGGEPAIEKEFPHMALLGYDNTRDNTIIYICGGSLISEYFVLTAAHCLVSREVGPVKYVKLGEFNTTAHDDGDVQNFTVTATYAHEENRQGKYNDIALVQLDRAVSFNSYIRPICLYTEHEVPTERAIATGWGRTNYFVEEMSDILQKVTLDMFTNAECNEGFKNYRLHLAKGIIDSQVCAGSRKFFNDTCLGDSGGPLQIYNEDEHCMFYQIGITSFGKPCGTSHTPGVFTRVSSYLKWIEDRVWPS